MFDSSSKLQAGILNGNLMDYGAFKQCISIQKYTQYGNLIGKHCSISLKPDKKLIWIILKFRNVSKKVRLKQKVERIQNIQKKKHFSDLKKFGHFYKIQNYNGASAYQNLVKLKILNYILNIRQNSTLMD